MASDVEIVNNALVKLGEATLLSLSDDSPAGRIAQRTFFDIRDALLREFPWNFATTRTTLAAEVTPPAWGFSRSYPVPADFLRLLEIDNPQNFPFQLEGGKILTDLSSPISIRYVKRVEEADAMDVAFREALAARLAAEWAEALSQTTTLTDQMQALYTRKLAQARAADGQEDDRRTLASCSFLDARA